MSWACFKIENRMLEDILCLYNITLIKICESPHRDEKLSGCYSVELTSDDFHQGVFGVPLKKG